MSFFFLHLQPMHNVSVIQQHFTEFILLYRRCNHFQTVVQSLESPAYLCLTDLVWTCHFCIRLSEWVGNQRCQHQGCWKACSQIGMMDSCIPLSQKNPNILSFCFSTASLSLFSLSSSHACPLLATVFLSCCFLYPLWLLIIFSRDVFFSLTTFLSLCILQTLAWFKSVHFLRLLL